MLFYPRNNIDNIQARLNNTLVTLTSNTDSRGMYTVNRSNAIDLSLYKNGSLQVSGVSAASLAVSNSEVMIGGGTTALSGAHQIAMVAIGGSITATEHKSFYDIMASYMNSVGVI